MILHITEQLTVNDLQQEFAKRFPFLKIELYLQQHEAGAGSKADTALRHDIKLGEATGNLKSGSIEVTGLTTVAALEADFQNTFGVAAQVFRKNGDYWLQTTATDNWTLAEQNSRARESVEGTTTATEPEDYREQL
jgi:hypothetical protein